MSRRSCSSPRVRLKLIVQLQGHYALDELDLVQDRGSGSGRHSVASLCDAIVASIDGIESETVVRTYKAVSICLQWKAQRHAADFEGWETLDLYYNHLYLVGCTSYHQRDVELWRVSLHQRGSAQLQLYTYTIWKYMSGSYKMC